MASLTLDQKKLEQIRTQLYGKQIELKKSKKTNQSTTEEKTPAKSVSNQSPLLSETYIKKDLTKVAVLSAIVLLMQFAVYYALTNKWLTINFYGITY